MIKKVMLILLLCAMVVVPPKAAQGALVGQSVISVHQGFGNGLSEPESYRMATVAYTDNPSDNVTVEGVPGVTGGVPLTYWGREAFFGVSWFIEFFSTPPPGDDWAGDYNFFVNGSLGATATVPEKWIKPLPLPGNPQITGGIHPTIMWEAIQGYDVFSYEIRISPLLGNEVDQPNLVYRSENLYEEGLENYSFTYEGDLFTVYPALAININCVAGEGSYRNVSAYALKHAVPLPVTVVLLASGLFGIAGLRRRLKR